MKNQKIKKTVLAMLVSIFAIVLAACSGGGGSSSGGAGEGGAADDGPGGKLGEILEKGKLVICTDPAWAPFEYIGANGEPVGVDIDIANKIAEELGVELEIVSVSFDSISNYISSGEVDMSLSCITITDERKEEWDFSVPYTTVQQFMVVNADSSIAVLEDLKGANIGTHLGTTGDFLVDGEINGDGGVLKDSGAQNMQYKALPDAANELKSGTLQAIICDSVLAENIVKANGDAFKCFTVKYADGNEAEIENIGIAMPKGDDDFVNKVSEIVQGLVDSGYVEESYVKHSEEASKL